MNSLSALKDIVNPKPQFFLSPELAQRGITGVRAATIEAAPNTLVMRMVFVNFVRKEVWSYGKGKDFFLN